MRNKRPSDGEFDAELRFHLDRLIEHKKAAGLSDQEARREAVLEFGKSTQLKEELRDVHRPAWAERLGANLRLALRLMRKSPGFSLAVIATLALGIGANSAVFSAIDAILLRPLPFPHGDQLMKLWQYEPKAKNPQSFVAPVRLEDWNRMNSTFQAISGWYLNEGSETSGSYPERVKEALVAPRFLEVWGVQPALGRDFRPEEERFGGPHAVLISDRYWRHKFGADPHVVGKRLRVEGGLTTVVGVMPASFLFPEREVDLWSPSPPDAPYAQSRRNTWFTVVGRVKPGVTPEEARNDLRAVQARLGRQFPASDGQLAVNVRPLKEETVLGAGRSLSLLFASVTLLLLIACTNIAALLLARTAERQREIAVRFSLGASRASIVLQLLTEYFALALAGAAAGLAMAWTATLYLRRLTEALPRAEEVKLDWRLVAYTLGCAVAATLLCGLFPAWRGTRRGIAGELAHAGRAQVSTRNPWQWALTSIQVALAVTLLSGAGLLLRSFQELSRVSLGYDPHRVLTLRISGNWGETVDGRKLTARIDRELDTLRATPGVEGAATTATLPGLPGDFRTEFRLAEKGDAGEGKIAADSRIVSDGYFGTLGIPVLAGGGCERGKDHGAVVNRSFADRYLAGKTPVGYHVQLVSSQFATAPFRVLGVAADAREEGANRPPFPTVYWCSSGPDPTPYFLVRTKGDPRSMAETLRHRLNAADPARSVFDVTPLEAHIDESFAENRLRTLLLTLFAASAMALAAVGLYGTLSYFVTVRRREVGLRLALGAGRGQIIWRFVRQGTVAALVGSLAGLGLAAASARWIAGMLYGVSAADPVTYAGVLAMVAVVTLLASLSPSIRASRLDPMVILREE